MSKNEFKVGAIMKTFTIEDIRSWNPCYDPSMYLSEDWSGNIVDILNNKEVPFDDRLWVICREDLMSSKILRLFAVWCARQVEHLMEDERSLNALDIAEKFANGRASKEELTIALDTARNAAWDAAWDAARAAARAAQEKQLMKMITEMPKELL